MKTAIITGADGDMGKQHTIALAQDGFNIIMACYCRQDGDKTCQEIKKLTHNEQIQVIELDLSSFDKIKLFVEKVKQTFDHVDVLLNNAGTLPSKPMVSANGYELTIAVNYLGHFLLTELLSPLFVSQTRIVSMVSLTYKYGTITENLFLPTEKYNRFVSYSNSKLALYYATLYWADKWKDKNIHVNCADPGLVSTHIIKMDNIIVDTLCNILFRPLIKTPLQGASTMIHVATTNDGNVSGQLFKNKKIVKVKRKIANNFHQQQLLINMTEKVLENYL